MHGPVRPLTLRRFPSLQPEVQVRQVAMKFASTVFARDHVSSRYLLLLAAGDPYVQPSTSTTTGPQIKHHLSVFMNP